MSQYDELLKNWEQFSKLVQEPMQAKDKIIANLARRYSEQNIEILNDVLASSIDHLKHLQKAKSLNDVVCTQARLTDEIGKKLMKAAQKFFNASLGNVSDYNEWLKAHCDMATD